MPFLTAGFKSSEVQEISDVLQRKKKSLWQQQDCWVWEVWVERTSEVRGLDHTWVLSCSGFIRCVTGADKWVPVLRENQAPSPGMHHQVVLALQQLP